VHNMCKTQNPLQTFARNFPLDGEVANLLWTCCGLTIGKLRGNGFWP